MEKAFKDVFKVLMSLKIESLAEYDSEDDYIYIIDSKKRFESDINRFKKSDYAGIIAFCNNASKARVVKLINHFDNYIDHISESDNINAYNFYNFLNKFPMKFISKEDLDMAVCEGCDIVEIYKECRKNYREIIAFWKKRGKK
jgi:hypothetical protein